jgi:thioredoxin reductase (NADPH)
VHNAEGNGIVPVCGLSGPGTRPTRVREFLAKNRVLFTWIDVETDPHVDRLFKQFGVTEADTPVVTCSAMLLLRNPSNRQLADRIGIPNRLNRRV